MPGAQRSLRGVAVAVATELATALIVNAAEELLAFDRQRCGD